MKLILILALLISSAARADEVFLKRLIESGDLAKIALSASRKAGLNPQSGEDVGAEVLLIFSSKPELLEQSTYENLLKITSTIADNQAVTMRRALSTQKRGGGAKTVSGNDSEDGTVGGSRFASVVSREVGPEEIAAQTELFLQVEKLIENSPPAHRKLLRRVVIDGISATEAQEEANIPSRTASRILKDFRTRARSQLGDCPFGLLL